MPRTEPSTSETGLTRVLQRERKQQLLDQLERLPEVQADAIRLRFFGELKYSEIAEALGCREITAKVRVRNGLATLSRLLRETMGEVP
jgi:RNA polymerase sigma-70 factor (ECF subfamily)